MITVIYLAYIGLILTAITGTVLTVGKPRDPVGHGTAAIIVLVAILQGIIASLLYAGVIQ